MPAKETATELAKSKTAWGGFVSWLASGLLTGMASGKPLPLYFGFDKADLWTVQVSPTVLFAVATAGFWLVLYGRSTVRRKILAAFGAQAEPASLETFKANLTAYADNLAKFQAGLIAAEKANKAAQQGEKPCDPPSSAA